MRIRVHLLLLLLLALTAAACAPGAEAPRGDVLAVASASTVAETSAAFRSVTQTIVEGDSPAAEFLEMELGTTGRVDFTTGDMEARMHAEGFMGALLSGTVLAVDGRQFMQTQLLSVIGEEDAWLTASTPDLDATASPLAGFGGTPDSGVNPADLLDLLQAEGIEAVQEGSEEVQGEPMTRWVAQPDVAALLESHEELLTSLRPDGQTGAAEAGAAAARRAIEDGEMTLEVWIDETDRVRRIRTTLDLTPFAGVDTGHGAMLDGLEFTSVTTIDYRDFGVAVDVVAPAPEQQISVEAFAQRLHDADPATLMGLLGLGGLSDASAD